MQAVRRDGSGNAGWAADPPWRNRWCPRWRSCGPPRERRWPEHRQPCTRLKSITIHLASPTTIACETKNERVKEMCECGPWMICIMFLRRAADKGKKDLFQALSRGFFPEDTKPYLAGPPISRTTVVVFQAKVQSDRCPNSTKNFCVILNNYLHLITNCSKRWEWIPIYLRRILHWFAVAWSSFWFLL